MGMTPTTDIAAVVLAAGMSTRMGRPKQLLPFGADDTPLIELVARRVRARIGRVIVVLGHRAGEISPLLRDCGVEQVVNEQYRQGMVTSVQCGIRAAGDARGYLICLGDQPGVSEEALSLIARQAEQLRKGIAIPVCAGRRGHPIYITHHFRAEILELPPDVGLNTVTARHPEVTREVPIADEAVLVDVDTPREYEESRHRWDSTSTTDGDTDQD